MAGIAVSLTIAGTRIDPETGEVINRRYNPDAMRYQDDTQLRGNYWVSAPARTEYSHERVILDAQFKPDGSGDGGVFTNMVLPMFAKVKEFRGAGHDMALHPVDQDRILDASRHVLTKTSLTNRAKRAHVPLGTYTFKATGREVTLPVTAFDGTPGIQMVIDGTRMWQPLERVQTKRTWHHVVWALAYPRTRSGESAHAGNDNFDSTIEHR